MAPAWTVVIPTYNRAEPLRATMASLAELEAPPGGVEILVVDDGGDVDLGFLEACREVRVHRQPNAGPAAARNTGAKLARGSFLAFTDDDCRPSPDWLLHFTDALVEHPNALVGGSTVNGLANNLFSEASQQLNSFLYAWQNGADDGPSFFASNNMGLARDVFLAVGGFDQRYPLAAGEDRAFCAAFRATGRPLVHVDQAVVRHHHALTLGRLWRQHERYGRAARRFHADWGWEGKHDRRPPGASRVRMTAALLRHPFRSRSVGGPIRRVGCSFLLALTQLATAVGYARDRWQSRTVGSTAEPNVGWCPSRGS